MSLYANAYGRAKRGGEENFPRKSGFPMIESSTLKASLLKGGALFVGLFAVMSEGSLAFLYDKRPLYIGLHQAHVDRQKTLTKG